MIMPQKLNQDCGRPRSEIIAALGNRCGSVAAEFALVAPILGLIAAGIIDFGILATKSARLAATTRIGAEYARKYPNDTGGIQRVMQNATSFALH